MSHEGRSSVLLQQMVQAEYAGVLFTRDPAANGLMLVELVQGTADELVSGAARPCSYRFGRVTKTPFGDAEPPIDLKPLLALGDEAERLFGLGASAIHDLGVVLDPDDQFEYDWLTKMLTESAETAPEA